MSREKRGFEKKRKGLGKKAVALQYDPEKSKAPFVVAKGSGLIAEKIIEIAEKYKIPLKSDPNLIQVLSKLDFQEEIPSEVYQVVAQILAYIYKVEEEIADK